jgi:threonine dehydrogenase-like Zn-dependent dehydrogenase
VPRPGSKELLVKVAAVGICASDAKCYTGAEVYWGKPGILLLSLSN